MIQIADSKTTWDPLMPTPESNELKIKKAWSRSAHINKVTKPESTCSKLRGIIVDIPKTESSKTAKDNISKTNIRQRDLLQTIIAKDEITKSYKNVIAIKRKRHPKSLSRRLTKTKLYDYMSP